MKDKTFDFQTFCQISSQIFGGLILDFEDLKIYRSYNFQMHTRDKSVRELFAHLAFKNLRTDFNKIWYRCTIYHNEGFNNGFFEISNRKKMYEQTLKNTFIFIAITVVLMTNQSI